MMSEQFSHRDAEHDEFPEWDGEPKIALTQDQLRLLYSFIPQWYGEALGPTIPFTGGRARVRVDSIFRTTREEAHAAMHGHCQASCVEEGMIYDSDEWDVTHLVLVNAC